MTDTLHFLEHVMRLKKVPRTGWIINGVKDPESVAEHCLGTAFFALALARAEGMDDKKIFLMASAHDLAESVVGDVVWEDGHKKDYATRDEKEDLEREALADICEAFGPDIKDLVLEYMELKSPEALIVKEADKLEMVMQALRYEPEVAQDTLLKFWTGSAKYFKSKLSRELFTQMLEKSNMSPEAKAQIQLE